MFRSRIFYIPKGATKVADKLSDAVAYIYSDGRGRPCVAVFYGKQAKPIGYTSFRSEAARVAFVASAFAQRQQSIARVAEQRKARTAENKLTVGDILNTCWGYDQTNREFYEVVEVDGKHVTIRELAQVRTTTAWEQGRCVPQSGSYIGEPMRKLVQWGDSVTIDKGRTASRWNTAIVAGVAVGPAVGWSGGH